MTVNPNWPTLFAEGEFGINPCYALAGSLIYTDLTPRLYQSWAVRRGKQFELDQVQAGEFNGQWRNTDGALDPTNTGSFLQQVIPYRGYRMRAQYPASINLLDGDLATGGEVTPLAPAAPATASGPFGDNMTYAVVASGTAYQGTQAWQGTGSPLAADLVLFTTVLPVLAVQGTPYSFSIRIRSVTTGANPVVQPIVKWFANNSQQVSSTTSGNVTLTGAPAAGWTTITLTDTVPGPSSGMYPNGVQVVLKLQTAPVGAWSLQMDGFQMEQASAASAFVAPGKGYAIFTGLIERYPQSWTNQGTYGLVTPICVDAFAPLSQIRLQEAFVMDINATNPTWFYPFNEPSGSTTFAEQAGRFPSVGLFSSIYGAGTLTVGNSVTAATTAGKFLGTAGPVVSVANPTQNQGTVIDLTPAGIISAPSTGAWTRMIAVRSTMTFGLPTFAAYSAGTYPGATGLTSNMFWDLQVTSGANMGVAASFYNAAGQQFGLAHTTTVNDGNWHLAFVQMSSDGKTITLNVDGVSQSSTGTNDMHPTLAINESVGGDEYKLSSTVGYGASNFTGDVALYAQWGTALTLAQMQNLYTSWRNAWQGDSTNARYSRILGWAGYTGPSSIGAGSTTSVGPATDVNGTDALTALGAVVDTEAGRHFAAADGTVTFQGRKAQFANTIPMWTFGENNGEIPYSNLTFDYDPTHVSNAVTVTQETTGQAYSVRDAFSQFEYGPRTLTRSSQSTNAEEVRQSAYFYLAKYSQPALRVAAARVNVGANPALFPSALAFEIGQRIRINRRDQTGARPTITTDGFIEQITHTSDGANAWFTDLQVSPAPVNAYGIFTTLQTTLFSGSTAGSHTITVSALPDAATNPIAANLTGGQQMVVGTGAGAETVTIATGGVPTTSPGYTSAAITLVAALTKNHSTSDPVAADASPQYYPASVFGSTQFCF